MHIEWSVFAIEDRTAIFDYIEADSPAAAATIDDRIEGAIEALAAFPQMGREGRVDGTRELVISGTPYIAAYSISGDVIVILRVLHGAQSWPADLP